jgi:hypothetical protein
LTGVQPTLLQDAMMKQINWEDQWIGYDDEDTVAMKTQFANNMCFGGTMAWSVDFNSGAGDGDTPPTSLDGRCGPDFGGTVCEGSGYGDCCSASSYCGSTDAHCGSGCQGGLCLIRAPTTDGTCGIGQYGSTCEGWSDGPCCSASGYCGSGDAYCSLDNGCQSGCDSTETPPTGDGGVSTSSIDPYVKGCSSDQIQMLVEAWKEAGELATLHRQWFPGKQWQDAMTLYMGSNTANDYSWITGTGPIESRLLSQYSFD